MADTPFRAITYLTQVGKTVAFSPDGKTIDLSGENYFGVKRWDLATENAIAG
jgi:hypothetical protein